MTTHATSSGFRHLGDEPRYEGRIWSVVRGRFEAPDGQAFERDIVRSPGAVGVVPVQRDAQGRVEIVLVAQYRPVLDRYVVEIPAGMRDVPGEAPEITARRELAEEVGREARSWHHLIDLHPSPGMTDSTTIVFAATGLALVPTEAHGPEEEHLEILTMGLDEVIQEISAGRITDAKTVIGVLMLQRAIDTSALVVEPRR